MVSGGEARLLSRKDQDYTERFANVAKELAKALKTPDAVVDGEVCALDEEGRPSFSAMQQGGAKTPIVYYVFDLLEVEGEPVIDLPLSERRARLRSCSTAGTAAFASPSRSTTADALLDAAEERRLEGIMGKRVGSRYLPGQALARLAEVQDARRGGVRDRRLHARPGAARGLVRLARARSV